MSTCLYHGRRIIACCRYVFLCDRWMAVDMDDGQLERLVPAASRKDLENFQV